MGATTLGRAAHDPGVEMPFDLHRTLNERQAENFRLHSHYVNPQMARVLKTIGFDRSTSGAKAATLDAEGARISTSSPVSASSPSAGITRR